MTSFKCPSAVLAVALFAAGTSACRDNTTAAAADVPRIEIKAAVAPFDGVAVSAPTDGRVATLNVQEGSPVQAGAVLMTLSSAAVDHDLAIANAQVMAAEARLRMARATPPAKPHAEESATADIVRAKQEKLDQYKKLLATGDVSKQEVLDLETDLAASKRELAAERQRDIAAPTPSDPALLEADLDKARADLVFAQHRQSLLTVTAPASGTVTQLRVHPGDAVYPRDPIAQIVDQSNVRVQAQIAPELLRYVHAGSAADVKLLTIPPRTFREPIARVEPPSAQGGAALSVNVPNPDRMLQPGTPAVITIQ